LSNSASSCNNVNDILDALELFTNCSHINSFSFNLQVGNSGFTFLEHQVLHFHHIYLMHGKALKNFRKGANLGAIAHTHLAAATFVSLGHVDTVSSVNFAANCELLDDTQSFFTNSRFSLSS
jgi:hypothetical protein